MVGLVFVGAGGASAQDAAETPVNLASLVTAGETVTVHDANGRRTVGCVAASIVSLMQVHVLFCLDVHTIFVGVDVLSAET